ncbi:MAG: hypothetical protein KatS3mg096_794 [Candidatus Parcubacteria bacterium]|nr:MAG: hypothetical protein KatS3mg096_794 [Candidatus Parcubacteria bacterium]
MSMKNNRLEVLTDWDWDYMRFLWRGKKYEMNISKAEFFQLCKRLYLSGYELIQKILDEGCDELKFKNRVVIKIIKHNEAPIDIDSPRNGGNNNSTNGSNNSLQKKSSKN